jgi:hypothetical protein
MRSIAIALSIVLCQFFPSLAADVIPFNEDNWEIEAKAFVLEKYRGNDAIYIQQGAATLKDVEFLDGTIEFDVFLTQRQAFPGVYFRQFDDENEESFFLRPHLSGKPDANQAAPAINGLVAWQLYFGERYSFAYDYNFSDWTHIRLVVNGDKAQVFMDHSETPNLSWILKHQPRPGKVSVGGSFAPMHYANFKITPAAKELVNFEVDEITLVEGVIKEWRISDKFDEEQLDDPAMLDEVIRQRSWDHSVGIEENSAVNISHAHSRYGSEGNTVFAKITIQSSRAQIKLLDFGYSDRVVAILNGQPIYRGDNKWRTRDYRYLGTVGFFDSIYLNLKQGENILLMAVSEDFGGWGVSGRFTDYLDIEVGY